MLDGEQAGVTPEGEELPVRATVPVKPPLAVSPIVDVALCPAGKETLVGLAQRVKSGVGGAVTETPIVVVRTSDPLVPVTVTVYEPAADEVSVHVDVCVPLMLVGEHDVVTPAGLDEAPRVTVPRKPPVAVMLIVDVALPPATNETLLGLADNEKSGVRTKNSRGEAAVTSFRPRVPPPQTSSRSLMKE
jgi:hypothetical protein